MSQYLTTGQRRARESARRAEKERLLQEHPHCQACDRRLVAEPFCVNSAHLVQHALSCPEHVKVVRLMAKSGAEECVIVLTAKGRAYVEAHRPNPREKWFVEGQEFRTLDQAEEHARELATLLGSNIPLLHGVRREDAKLVEIIRPGNGARIREEAFRNITHR